MYYLIKNWEIVWSSDHYLTWDGETILADFTDEQLDFISKKYDFIAWEFVKWDRAIAYEKEMIEARKQAIIMELWSLKQEKDGLTLLGEDTKEVDAKITALKTEYKTLIA